MTKLGEIDYRALVLEVSDGIYICDLNGTFIFANLALADMLGFESPANIIGRNFVELLPIDRGKVIFKRFLESIKQANNSELFTTEIVRQDGTAGFIEIKPMAYIKEGELAGSQGIVHDITALKQADDKKDYQSTHDSATGLYNRTFFEAELTRLERGRQFPISIVVVDVDISKKETNGEEYKPVENQIKRIAHALYSSFRGDDIVARIGEFEFAILLPNVDETIVEKIITRVRENILEKTNYQVDKTFEFYIRASTGKKKGALNSVLQHAKDIIHLEKKKKSDS
jgi:diguanylate cyclase (GGDEF)-like protein/PAS domain S-box-containing protein